MAAERDRLPSAIVQAASDRRGGATEVARRALDGLLEIAGDPGLLALAAEVLLEGQPAMAPIWHLAGAARSDDPAAALAGLRERLDHDGAAAVEVAASWVRKWLDKRPGPVATVSHSSQVNAVLQHLGQRVVVAEAGRRNAVVALVGSDAIGPKALLNAAGARRRRPPGRGAGGASAPRVDPQQQPVTGAGDPDRPRARGRLPRGGAILLLHPDEQLLRGR